MTFFARALGLALLAALLAAPAARAATPRPEHPRPDFERAAWQTLNGEWQFEIDKAGDGEARGLQSGKALAGRIIVPFCPESKLSGVGNTDHMKDVWYRRTFELPEAMRGQRVLLHFGGVDYQSWVWVNGKPVGTHTGGDVAFACEITSALRPGANEVVVHAFDDTRSGLQPTGKQSHGKSEGCVYTRTTGIWQPVWLEAVGTSYIENFSITPDPERSRVMIDVQVNGPCEGLQVTARATADGKRVGADECPAQWRNGRLVVNLSEKKLWEPGRPFLYDLDLSLTRGGETVDAVKSYFGLRSVAIEGRAILINGKRVFQRLILDQGFYPDGIWTAPSDEALKHDIEMSMACGYNGARLHQKAFEPRYLYWADKLGYLVWGEFPNWGYNFKPEGYAPYITEWTEALLRDRNHPSIIGWCPSNESGPVAGELQRVVWNVTRAVDPTRPVLETSGWTHTLPNPEVRDDHDYTQNPESFKAKWLSYFTEPSLDGLLELPERYGVKTKGKGQGKPGDNGVPFMVSEFGGIGWERPGRDGKGWGYGQGPKTEEEFYERYAGLVAALLDNPYMFGFCYTQLTDVEQEHNGLYYYDRTPKFDVKRLHDATAREAAIEKAAPPAGVVGEAQSAPEKPQWKVLSGAAADGELNAPYRYTFDRPAAEWLKEGFSDGDWKTAPAPFGWGLPGVKTNWRTPEIWLRRSFEAPAGGIQDAALVIFHDEDAEVYVNGEKIWGGKGYLTGYKIYPVTAKLKKALRPGKNTLAVHVSQSSGGQYIDLALLAQ